MAAIKLALSLPTCLSLARGSQGTETKAWKHMGKGWGGIHALGTSLGAAWLRLKLLEELRKVLVTNAKLSAWGRASYSQPSVPLHVFFFFLGFFKGSSKQCLNNSICILGYRGGSVAGCVG